MKSSTIIFCLSSIAIIVLVFSPQQSSCLSRRKMMKIQKLAALALILKPRKKMMPIPIPIPIPMSKEKLMMMLGKDDEMMAHHQVHHEQHVAMQPQPLIAHHQLRVAIPAPIPVPVPIRIPVPVQVPAPPPVHHHHVQQPIVAYEYQQETPSICHH